MTPPHKLPPRPKAATLFMAAPIVFIGAMGVAVAVLWGVTRFGSSTATGAEVEISFSSPCMDAAAPLLLARAQQVGMPAQMEGSVMTVTLPDMQDAERLIPDLLVQPGHFSLTDKDGSLSLDNGAIDEVAIDLDDAGMPVTIMKLNAGARAVIKDADAELTLIPEFDGNSFAEVRVSLLQESPEVSLYSGEGRTSVRMKRAADRAIVLAHGPLPCTVRVTGVAAVQGAG